MPSAGGVNGSVVGCSIASVGSPSASVVGSVGSSAICRNASRKTIIQCVQCVPPVGKGESEGEGGCEGEVGEGGCEGAGGGGGEGLS